jgi:transposase
MSLQPRPLPDVPELTARAARASSPRGNLVMRIRDELGEVYADARFTQVFGVRGRPGISPGQLLMVCALQFCENLTDRQAAEAVRDRITWKYALGLELEDPGFDASVLSEFRSRLVAGDLTSLALEALLERLRAGGLLKGGGRARTDSTHVLGAIRDLNRLELVGETVRAGLEALAVAAGDWLATVIDPSWQNVYGARIDRIRQPESRAKRDELLLQYGRDGYYLLDQIHAPGAPGWLRELPAVEGLRRIWVQQFSRQIDDGRQEVTRRRPAPDGDGMPPVRDLLLSPYDLDARYGRKRETAWQGYKVHFTETCNPAQSSPTTGTETAPDPDPGPGRGKGRGEQPNLIINVLTTTASVTDAEMTTPIHQQLAVKDLMPAEHLLDSGYPSIENLLYAAHTWGLTLITPLLVDSSVQAKAGQGYDSASFSFDFDARQGTCPQQVKSTKWTPAQQKNNRDVIVVAWPTSACRPCPVRQLCTRSTRRQVTIRPREMHEALTTARIEQTTQAWKTRYATRAGVEGTIRQSTHVTGIRRARYHGLPKTHLEHTLAAAAINLIRLDAYWTGHPLDRTRTTHLTRLDFTQAA